MLSAVAAQRVPQEMMYLKSSYGKVGSKNDERPNVRVSYFDAIPWGKNTQPTAKNEAFTTHLNYISAEIAGKST